MKKFKDLKLSTKFMVSIGCVLVVLTAFDVWFSMKKEEDIMLKDINNWTFVFAENVRTSLNTLMREGKMDIRFAMMEAMSTDIKGVQNVRIIRGPKVNEIFTKLKSETIQSAEDTLAGYARKKEQLENNLKKTKDPDEKKDIKEDLATLQDSMNKVSVKMATAKVPLSLDPREAPMDDLDREVLAKGVPVYRFEGDKARVLVPYIASKKSCATTSGCHKYANEGDVLGAISMEFSTEDINKEIIANNLKTAGLGIVRLVIILGLLAIFLSIFIVKDIKTMMEGFKALTNGDFTIRLRVSGDDEMGKLAQGFNYFIDRFNDIVKELHGATGKLTSTSKELSAFSSQIAAGADSQGVKVNQVSTAAGELSATATEIAMNSVGAADAAKDANEIARKGSLIVANSIEGMNSILPLVKDSALIVEQLGSRSKEIGNIIGVITDIADQTNLLALNAAIEAARAGDQGRGFAVVADEVKKLAERTAIATKEVGTMIKTIQDYTGKAQTSMAVEVKAVEKASEHVRGAGAALKEITAHVDKVAAMIGQIATASEEQSTVANQISEDIEAVSKVTSSTAEDVSHIAATAVDLLQLSLKLQELTSRFKTDIEAAESLVMPLEISKGSDRRLSCNDAVDV